MDGRGRDRLAAATLGGTLAKLAGGVLRIGPTGDRPL